LCILAVCFIVLKRIRDYGLSTGWQLAAVATVFWVSRYGWAERADLVSLIFFSGLFWHLERFMQKKSSFWSLGLWIPLFILWCNLHAGFIFGLCLAGAYAWPGGKGKGFFSLDPKMTLWGLVCAGATLANPYGIQLHHFIWKAFGLTSQVPQSEFQNTPWFHMELFWISLVACYVFLFRASLRRRDIHPCSWLITAVLTLEAVRHVRYVPFFMAGPFCLIFLALPNDPWIQTAGSVLVPFKRPMMGVVSLAVLIFSVYAAHTSSFGIRPGLPVGICDFIAAHHPAERYYNDYAFGSYWVWRFRGDPPVFVDGRSSSVEGYIALRRQITTAQRGTPDDWNTFLDRYAIDAAAYPYAQNPVLSSVFAAYFPRKRWALVYWDDIGLLFVRRTARSRQVISDFEFRCLNPDADLSVLLKEAHSDPLQARCMREEALQNFLRHPESQRARALWAGLGS